MMLSDIGQYLQEKGVGTLGTDVFIGQYPDTPDNCIVLMEVQGLEENVSAGTETPCLQVAARWTDDYNYAQTKLKAIHDVLRPIGYENGSEMAGGVVINGRQYFHVQPAFSGLLPLEDDEQGRMRIARNYYITKEEE